MARSPSAHALRWVSCLPFAVRERDRFRLVALAAHTAPLPIAPRAPALSIPATGPHAHKAIARPLPFPTTTGLAPQLVLAGIATSVAISFNILLPVVPVLMERRGPHGAAGAATAALFVGAVAGEVLTPWLMSRWSSTRLLVVGQLMTAVPSLVYVLPPPDAWLMLVAAAARGLGMGVAIVVAVALVGEFAAPDRRGRSMGYFGFALTAPGVVVPSAAVALLGAGHAAADAASRWFAGILGDRGTGRLLLLGSIGVTFVGLVALASHLNSLVVIFAAAAFGAGYGAVQTAIYLAMVARGSSDHRNNISALWNSGIDLGASLGGTLIGLAASRYGYGAAIWAFPAVVLISLPLVLLPGRAMDQSEPSGGAQKTTSTSSSSIS